MADNNGESFEVNYLFETQKDFFKAFENTRNFCELLYDFDSYLLGLLNPDWKIEYQLEDLQFSSVRTKLTQILKDVPDEAIKNLDIKKLIGHYLLKLKYKFLSLLEGKTIDTKQPVEELKKEITKSLSDIQDNIKLLVNEANVYIILNYFERAEKVTNNLKSKEQLEYKAQDYQASLSKGLQVDKESILKELGQTEITNRTTEIIKPKKIDLLSDTAKWDFIQEDKPMRSALIKDYVWLSKFHNREVLIRPEDSLKVIMKTTQSFSKDFLNVTTSFEVEKVIDIVTPDNNQLNLF